LFKWFFPIPLQKNWQENIKKQTNTNNQFEGRIFTLIMEESRENNQNLAHLGKLLKSKGN